MNDNAATFMNLDNFYTHRKVVFMQRIIAAWQSSNTSVNSFFLIFKSPTLHKIQGDQMICSKNAQNLAKNARHSAHHNFTRKCPKCPIFSLFPASSPPKMPTFMPKQKTRIPFFAQNIVKFCIFWAGPDNF